jgi:predicted translin family RNA/ssDNA-binding protein
MLKTNNPMLDKKYFQKIRQELLTYAEKRREVIKECGDAQHLAKRAIFALQRDDKAEAQKALAKAEKILSDLNKKHQKVEGIFDEGSYKASLEEYVEAVLFNQFLEGKSFSVIKGLHIDSEVYIGGLADVPGEVLRYAIKSATQKNFMMVKKCFDAAEEIVGEMVDMNLTGYNRQKFDQAKQALHKLQQVVYEVSLRE